MKFRKALATYIAVLGVIAGSIVAYAAWSAQGTGSGRAATATAQAVTASAATGTADMYPGGPAGAVYFSLTNHNPYSITFDHATFSTPVSSDPLNCPASNVTVPSGSQALAATVHSAAATTSGALSIPSVVSLAHTAGDGCQNVTFTVTITLSGTQD